MRRKEKEKGEKESETDRQTEGETLAADDEKQIVWEKVEVEGACKSEERGLTRCRGGSQGTWEMHSSRCQSPHQAAQARAPPGPTTNAPGRRAIAGIPGTAHRDLAVSLHWTIPSGRDDRLPRESPG